MNQRESVAVVAVFQAAWGHVEVGGRTMAVWHDTLRQVPAADGLDLARDLVRTSAHFPAPSAFWALWKARQRRVHERESFARGLPSGARETAADDAPRRLAELRAAMRAARQEANR